MKPASERGSLSVFVAILAVFLVMIAAVVGEGGRRLANISRAEDLASEAARAAAATLALGSLATGQPTIDQDSLDGAEFQAEQILLRAGDDVEFQVMVSPSGRSVEVQVIVQADSILPLFDIRGYGSHRAQVIDPAEVP